MRKVERILALAWLLFSTHTLRGWWAAPRRASRGPPR